MIHAINEFTGRFRRDQVVLAALCVFIGIQLPWRLNRVPPFWFDEGWAASVARHWVERGHYGHLLAGKAVPNSILRIGFPAIAPIGLSFRLLGVGVWQARLPGVAFTVGTLAALWLLARRLYGRSVATVTLAAALLLPVLPAMHPVLVGRQALGEMPALFYLLVGLLCLQRAWHRPRMFLPLAALFWGLALQTKPQILPFLVTSLLLPLGLLLRKRCSRPAFILIAGLGGAFVASVALGQVSSIVISGVWNAFAAVGELPSRHLFKVFQLNPASRVAALFTVLLTATPVLLGLSYSGWQFARDLDQICGADERVLGRVILWILAASWLAWYLFLSIGWAQYLFPAVLLGNVFTATLLHRLTDGFTFAPWTQWVAVREQRGVTISRIGTLTTLLVIPVALLLTLYYVYASLALVDHSSALEETARFLNTGTEASSLIETYESELFLFLDRPYHFPPDEVQHRSNRRVFLGESVTIDYDPLSANPDYLVVGPIGRWWGLYDTVLQAERFRLVHANERYQVFERVRDIDEGKESGG